MKRIESRASAAMRMASALLRRAAGWEVAAVPSNVSVDMMGLSVDMMGFALGPRIRLRSESRPAATPAVYRWPLESIRRHPPDDWSVPRQARDDRACRD